MKKGIILFLILGLGLSTFAQYREGGSSSPSLKSRFIQPQNGLFGLFNNPNLNMSQSYSLMFTSSSGGSVMQGLYMNSINYRLSGPLLLNMNLGFLHQPYSSGQGGSPGQNIASFIGGVALIFRPNNNMIFSVGMDNVPYCPYSGYPNYFNFYPYNLNNFNYGTGTQTNSDRH
jgi:hypothetical protein